MNNSVLKKYIIWLVLLLSIVFSIAATVHYYNIHEILAYNDARSRLDIARRVTDSKTPGIVQLGTIWLPLQQFLMFPLVANHTLWQTGLGGSIVSMLAYVFASVYLYKTVFILTKKPWLGVFGSLLFMLNINVLYMQTTAMNEVILFATMTAGLYYFLCWLQDKRDMDLVIASFCICLATLVRYEGWLMLIVCAIIVYYENRYHLKNSRKAQGQTLLFLTLGGFGVFLWLLWNLVFFANPLYFIVGQQGQYSLNGHASPNRHHLITTLDTIWRTVGYNVGFTTLIIAVLGIAYILINKSRNKRYDFYLLLILLSPIVVNIVTLFTGTTNINAVSLSQAFDVRYGLVSIILVAVVFVMAIDRVSRYLKPFGIAGALLLLLTVQPSSYLGAVNGGRSLNPKNGDIVSFMSKQYKTGNILASTYAFDPEMNVLAFPLKDYIYEGNGRLWKDTLISPEKYATYIMMSATIPHDPVYDAYNNEPTEDQCEDAGFRNFNQCVKEWKHHKNHPGHGYGGDKDDRDHDNDKDKNHGHDD